MTLALHYHDEGMATQEQIEEVITSIITSETQSYSIGNRSVTKLDAIKLLELQRKVSKDGTPGNGGRGITLAKFRKPGK